MIKQTKNRIDENDVLQAELLVEILNYWISEYHNKIFK